MRNVLKDAKTPNGDSLIDEVNDGLRVSLVAGSISLTGADGAVLDGVDSNIKATVLDKANSNPQAVAVVDGNGDQITSFGGGTQYTEGDTDATITGTAMLWEDAADTLRAVSAAKPLPIGDAGGSLTVDGTVAVTDGGGSLTVDGTFWQATQPVSIAAAVAVTDNAGSLTIDNAQLVTLAGAVAGTEMQVDVLTMPTTTVQATNLDIRDLVFASDKVDASGTVLGSGTNNIGDVDVLSITGTGSIAQNQVSVTNVSGTVVAARAGRRSLLIVNHGTTDVYLGTGVVTTSNGLLLTGTKGASVSIPTSAAVNGIVASGTQTVSYIEVF